MEGAISGRLSKCVSVHTEHNAHFYLELFLPVTLTEKLKGYLQTLKFLERPKSFLGELGGDCFYVHPSSLRKKRKIDFIELISKKIFLT